MTGPLRLGVLLGATLAALVSVATPGPAHGQTYTIGRYGFWSAFGGTSDDGTPLCGIISSGNERILTLKYFRGANHLTVQIMRSGWRIPSDTPIELRMQFGVASPWDVRGTGRTHQNGLGVIEARLAAGRVGDFVQEFRGATQGRIAFLEGNEGAWTMNLNGSNAALDAMVGCMREMRGGGGTQPFSGGPTQPFSGGPTQPFSGGPTQPFSGGIGGSQDVVPNRPFAPEGGAGLKRW